MLAAMQKTDSCRADAKNTYEVYIPNRTDADRTLPLLVILDSHGSGKFALAKFKQAANRFPAVLVASNLVKNGLAGYDAAIMTLINDVRQKYPVGETVFLTGFSGGARMALGYAQAHPVNGLILCGALAGSDQINALRCPIISISGMDDFNFMETAQYLFQQQPMPGNLNIELTNASHDWPDSLMLANALGFLRLSCKSDELAASSPSQLEAYCRAQQARISTLKKQGDYLKATLIARNMSSVEVFDGEGKTFTSIYNSLKSSREYTLSLERLANSLNKEISLREPYIEAFTKKDSLWWKNEIKANEANIKFAPDEYMQDMYRRIKGFWGIVCYSLGNQAVQQRNVDALNRIVAIYRMLEPDNSYVYYFAAFPYYWQGNNEAAVASLKKGLKLGFTDLNQLKRDFPETVWSKVFAK
jgi:dienelactone hydrolase